MSFTTCSSGLIGLVLPDDREVQLLVETKRARHLHQSGISSEECPMRSRPAAWPRVAGCMRGRAWRAIPPNDYAGGKVIMTSYQELTAKSKCSPPLKEVINLDPGGRSHPEVCSLHDSWRQEVEDGFYSPYFSMCTLSDSPPPRRECEGLLTSASLHSSGVPWRRRAQTQSSAGRGYSKSNEARHWCFGPHAEPLEKPLWDPHSGILGQNGQLWSFREEENFWADGRNMCIKE